jgi:branched-chain amino acid transport system substrate-binding protein
MFAKSWLFRLPALALAMAALTPSIGAAQTSDKIRVGMTVSSTGSFALASQSGVRGVELWVDDVNRRGGTRVRITPHLSRRPDLPGQQATRLHHNLF